MDVSARYVSKEAFLSLPWPLWVGLGTCMWFYLATSGLAERLLLSCLPDPFRVALTREWVQIRYRCHHARFIKREHASDDAFVTQLMNRSLGMLNSFLALAIGFYCTCFDSFLIANKIEGRSAVWTIGGGFVVGYFIWDLITVLRNFDYSWRSTQWLIHAVICLLALGSPFFATVAPMHYYAAALLLMEASTPLLSLRWLTLKTLALQHRDDAPEDTILFTKRVASVCSLLFVASFFISRLIFGPIYIFLPLMRFFLFSPVATAFSFFRWWGYVIAIPSFVLLNVAWMIEILHATVVPRAISKSA